MKRPKLSRGRALLPESRVNRLIVINAGQAESEEFDEVAAVSGEIRNFFEILG